MPAHFDKVGVRFAYPENWSVDLPENTGADLSVTVSSEGTAFWSLSVYSAEVLPIDLLAEALAAMQAEYPTLEYEATEDEVEDQLLVGYDLSFFYLDLCNSGMIRVFRRGESTYLLICQAEDREMAQTEPVFRAMTVSLLRNAPPDEL